MINLVLLSYGRKTEYLRAASAVLSFWAWHRAEQATVRTIVFTDDSAGLQPYLANLPVVYKYLSDSDIIAMKGAQQFVHRVKVAIVDRVFQEYPGEALLFIDSDTFFRAPPQPLLAALAAGSTFMHEYEYTLAEAVGIYTSFGQEYYPRKLIAQLESRQYQLGEAKVQFHRGQHSWNSGVLGLPPSVAALVPDIYTLTDDFYASSGWFTSEQMAFSLALQTHAALQPCQRYVYHYWGEGQKVLMDSLLPNLLTKGFSQLTRAAQPRQVRQLVPQWQRQLELHKVREGALYALGQGQLRAGLKYTAKALLADPLDVKFAKEVYFLLRSRARQRSAMVRASRR